MKLKQSKLNNAVLLVNAIKSAAIGGYFVPVLVAVIGLLMEGELRFGLVFGLVLLFFLYVFVPILLISVFNNYLLNTKFLRSQLSSVAKNFLFVNAGFVLLCLLYFLFYYLAYQQLVSDLTAYIIYTFVVINLDVYFRIRELAKMG